MSPPHPVPLDAVLAGLGTLGFDVAIEHDPAGAWMRLDEYVADPDLVDAGLRLAGHRAGRLEPCAVTAGWLVVAAAVTWPAAAVHDVAWTGGAEHPRVRNICCLWYRTEGCGLCLTCPRISDRERRELLERHHPAT